MSAQPLQSVLQQGPLVHANYYENNQITLHWNATAGIEAVAIYHSELPEFDETLHTLLPAHIQPAEASFTRPLSHGRSYYHVKFAHGPVSTVTDRMIFTDGIINFRDMGGYRTRDGRTIRWGALLRSADLYELNQQDLRTAEMLGIDWICDLRSDAEVAKRPSPAIGKAVNTNIPFMAEANPEEMQRIGLDLHSGYKAMILNTAKCALILRELLVEERATVLFHCAAGKDRTGVVCALILLTLGVQREVIIEDYELTNLALDGLMQRFLNNSKDYIEIVPDLDTIPNIMRATFIEAALDAIDEAYGSFEQYLLEGLGISADEIAKLQSKYLV
ncbi:tyrosine-protein phosphatase [Paenibacillus albidus]|uniref:tyrosine-protein phosphatase n=1 Tax=Paenibacillus albidus TaxID=2041023 RepID=UPI001BEC13F5|nr:tyrosine-protein phosphatase [Paenibacillus albidus]MBT2291365.1 tyrosine-protein phosphatase [Paenibacillus albidus]